MADLAYTTEDKITLLAGQIAKDLRTDDDDPDNLIAAAINFASGQIDFYCSKYSETELAASRWVSDTATFIAVMWLCRHRLNDVSGSIQKTWDEILQPQLGLIQQGKAVVPRAATSRNPATVTNYAVDLRRPNNQIRVDRSRSTGQAQDYTRPVDQSAPDMR